MVLVSKTDDLCLCLEALPGEAGVSGCQELQTVLGKVVPQMGVQGHVYQVVIIPVV